MFFNLWVLHKIYQRYSSMYNGGGLMLKMYCCPECNGTEITWDRRLRKAVCVKDKTPISEFRLLVDSL